MFYEEDPGYYAPEKEYTQYEEDHEIEAVLSHMREEGRENDPEDIWHENIVRSSLFTSLILMLNTLNLSAFPHQMERLFTSA